jgi:peptide/nickel transport system permease protein
MKIETAPPTAPILPSVEGKRLTGNQLRRLRRRKAAARTWGQFRTSKMGMAGLIILILFFGVALFSLFADKGRLDPTITTNGPVLASPSWHYPFGTDAQGISVFSEVIEGTRMSLFVGLTATILSMLLGTLVGVWSGYKAGIHDVVLMRITDFFLVLPWLALAIVLAAIFGHNVWVIIGIIGFTSWAGTSRLVRSQVLSVKERTYVERSRALGASDWYVATRHVLPNVMPVIFANTILTVALAILAESALSFLGLGDPLRVTWGSMIDKAFHAGALSLGKWAWLMGPSMCIVVVVLAFTMVGFAFDEIVNPRIRER